LNVENRRIADVGDRELGRLNWADSGPCRGYPFRLAIRTRAVFRFSNSNQACDAKRPLPEEITEIYLGLLGTATNFQLGWLLSEHVGADFSPYLDDGVTWYVVAQGRGADRLRTRRLVETIGLLLVRAEEGKDPRHALLVVDALDGFDALLRRRQLLGKVPFD